MPFFFERDEENEQELIDTGGLNKETLRKRGKVVSNFKSYLEEHGNYSIDDVVADLVILESALKGYFASMRILQNGAASLPSKSYSDTIKSHLKQFFVDLFHGLDAIENTYKESNTAIERMAGRHQTLEMKRLCVEGEKIDLEKTKEDNRAREQREMLEMIKTKDDIIMKLLSCN